MYFLSGPTWPIVGMRVHSSHPDKKFLNPGMSCGHMANHPCVSVRANKIIPVPLMFGYYACLGRIVQQLLNITKSLQIHTGIIIKTNQKHRNPRPDTNLVPCNYLLPKLAVHTQVPNFKTQTFFFSKRNLLLTLAPPPPPPP